MKSSLPLATDPKNYGIIHEISGEMLTLGLPPKFIERARRLAMEFEGGFDLLLLWRNAADQDFKNEVLADIEEQIDEIRLSDDSRPFQRPKIDFDDIENMGIDILAFKKKLRQKVDAWGGVSKLASAIEMPAPSLYRFFSSASMPRKTTLYKIANAIGLEEKDIAFEYTK